MGKLTDDDLTQMEADHQLIMQNLLNIMDTRKTKLKKWR
jgi:hypothetical protein